jgi:hypothetical protein
MPTVGLLRGRREAAGWLLDDLLREAGHANPVHDDMGIGGAGQFVVRRVRCQDVKPNVCWQSARLMRLSSSSSRSTRNCSRGTGPAFLERPVTRALRWPSSPTPKDLRVASLGGVLKFYCREATWPYGRVFTYDLGSSGTQRMRKRFLHHFGDEEVRMPVAELEKAVELDQKVVVTAIEKAKAKNARLRLMKERNENYLAEQNDEREVDDEFTKELK